MPTSFTRYASNHYRLLAAAPASIYAISFVLPAMELQFDIVQTVIGWQAFIAIPRMAWNDPGPLAILALATGQSVGGYHPLLESLMVLFWMPNPLVWFCFVCLITSRLRLALAAGAVAILLALFPAAYFAHVGFFPRFFAGYYLWLGSMVLASVLASIGVIEKPAVQTAATQ